MLTRWQGGLATVAVVVLTVLLVLLDVIDDTSRRWWAAHAFTTSTVAGLLVLAITVLVVNQVLSLRQVKDRAQATAAQAAIVLGQADRAAQAVSSAQAGSGERDSASDEVRTYLTMLLIAAPVLIDSAVPRAFLERAQQLAGALARTLALIETQSAATSRSVSPGDLDDAVGRLRAAATPVLRVLSPAQRSATGADEVVKAAPASP